MLLVLRSLYNNSTYAVNLMEAVLPGDSAVATLSAVAAVVEGVTAAHMQLGEAIQAVSQAETLVLANVQMSGGALSVSHAEAAAPGHLQTSVALYAASQAEAAVLDTGHGGQSTRLASLAEAAALEDAATRNSSTTASQGEAVTLAHTNSSGFLTQANQVELSSTDSSAVSASLVSQLIGEALELADSTSNTFDTTADVFEGVALLVPFCYGGVAIGGAVSEYLTPSADLLAWRFKAFPASAGSAKGFTNVSVGANSFGVSVSTSGITVASVAFLMPKEDFLTDSRGNVLSDFAGIPLSSNFFAGSKDYLQDSWGNQLTDSAGNALSSTNPSATAETYLTDSGGAVLTDSSGNSLSSGFWSN